MPNDIDATPCPLNNEKRNCASRYNPKNAMAAHCHQLHDTLRVAYGIAHTGDQEKFNGVLDTLAAQMNVARGTKTGIEAGSVCGTFVFDRVRGCKRISCSCGRAVSEDSDFWKFLEKHEKK